MIFWAKVKTLLGGNVPRLFHAWEGGVGLCNVSKTKEPSPAQRERQPYRACELCKGILTSREMMLIVG